LQSLSNQLHDFNVGMGPDVGNVPGGNNFGTRVFWTAVVPEGDVQISPVMAEMHVHNLAALDYPEDFGSGSLGPNWQTAYVPATVSLDVVWTGPVTRRVTVVDATDQFAGTFNESQAVVTWSAQSTSGFSFISNPGDSSTSTPGAPNISTTYFFAEIGHEKNGIFFPHGHDGGGNFTLVRDAVAVPAGNSQTLPFAAALAHEAPGRAETFDHALEWRLGEQRSAQDRRPPLFSSLQHRMALHGPVLDQWFADLAGSPFSECTPTPRWATEG
jgi:hypothetical protein